MGLFCEALRRDSASVAALDQLFHGRLGAHSPLQVADAESHPFGPINTPDDDVDFIGFLDAILLPERPGSVGGGVRISLDRQYSTNPHR